MDWKQMFHKSRVYPVVLVAICYVVYLYRESGAENIAESATLKSRLVLSLRGVSGEICKVPRHGFKSVIGVRVVSGHQ